MVIPCLCLFRFSSCTIHHEKSPQTEWSGGIFLGRHSYALGTLTESDGWRLYGLRLLIFPQPLGRALKNQNAAPASAPCFRRRRRSPPLLFEPCTVHHKTAVIPVDIPMRWEPRTNKHPTGVFVAPPAAVPCCSRPVPPTKTKRPDSNESGCFGGRYRTRTCDLLHVKQMLYQLS